VFGEVAGLTLAVLWFCWVLFTPCGGQVTPAVLVSQIGFKGLLPTANGNLKVNIFLALGHADRYRDEFRNDLQYVISVQGYEWGWLMHQVRHSIRLEPECGEMAQSRRTQHYGWPERN
jgi:purine-binding chemotaxis protein CheW